MGNEFVAIGVWVRDLVLFCAGLLKQEAAPGLVTLVLLLSLGAFSLGFAWVIVSRVRAVNWLRGLVTDSKDVSSFGQSIDRLASLVKNGQTTRARGRIGTAWDEYRETLVPHDEGGVTIYRNSARPSFFFNTDDLGFAPGFWRILPGLFVSIGLFCTFLGLISALSSMDLSAGKVEGSLKELLTIASAKFIMSLTGLLCSILFTIFLRLGTSALEDRIHKLCDALEKRLTFISLEYLATEQLKATREQREHFRLIGLELVAELGRPLREELPAAITASITSAMSPLIDQVGRMGTESMGSLVQDLSSRFSDDVGRALARASDSLVVAGDRIMQLADRMDQSSGRVGTEMDAAVNRLTQAVDDLRGAMGQTAQTASATLTQGAEQLLAVMNQTLEGIRDNTGEGARALSEAAGEMRQAAQGFRIEIEKASAEGAGAARERMEAAGTQAVGAIGSAGVSAREAVERTARQMTEVSERFAEKAARDLLVPLHRVSEQLGTLVGTLSEGSTNMRRLSDGVRAGAEATEQAAGSFRTASEQLVSAVPPIRTSNERIEVAIGQLRESTQNAATTMTRSSQETALSAERALFAAQTTIGHYAEVAETVLGEIKRLVAELKGQGDRFDQLSGQLGKAYEAFFSRSEASVETLHAHAKRMTDDLAPALATLQTVVEQAEKFMPESRVGVRR